jgi:hypothetical protein
MLYSAIYLNGSEAATTKSHLYQEKKIENKDKKNCQKAANSN